MANLSAAKLRRKATRPRSPPPPPSSKSNASDDEAKLPSKLGALVLAALNTPLSTGAALSASSLTSTPSARKPTPTPSIRAAEQAQAMPPARPVHLLIASLGNPPPYHNTRHSAGHILLKSLASHLHAPPLAKSRDHGGAVSNITTEQGTSWTFFQSPSLMNASGPAVLRAFKAFAAQHPRSPDYDCGLVILHDELELESGRIKVKRGEGSAKGHNGIKSVQQSLQSAGLLGNLGPRFVKVGVGIGRPLSREKDEVSGYVLGQLSGGERMKIEGAVAGLVDVLEKESGVMGK